MISNIKTVAFQGVTTLNVDVQIHMAKGMPSFSIVGLPDKSVAESRDRIRAALTSVNLAFPVKRITVNLSPADLFKEGSHYDLPIALGLLILIGAINQKDVDRFVVMGELSLDGSITSVSGVLPAAVNAYHRNHGLICPSSNGPEAAIVDNLEIIAPSHLVELIDYLKFGTQIKFPQKQKNLQNQFIPDLKDVKGQYVAKRALEIAAAGGHNLLMIGPPGTGKSMLAKRLIGLLPDLSHEEMMEINVIASVYRKFYNECSNVRPFREPHNSCSVAAMVGGGRDVNPGEITLAHHGVLFLDELPEFPRPVLEALRQPLENKNVTISRANGHIIYPAKFQLVAAMNPCRCGYFGDVNRSCNKVPRCKQEYQSKISGPLLDRIDLHTEVPYVNLLSIQKSDMISEDTATVKKRIIAAREMQSKRYKDKSFKINSDLNGEDLIKFVHFDHKIKELLQKLIEERSLSPRGYSRLLKVARTIADLNGSEEVLREHFLEALVYRPN